MALITCHECQAKISSEAGKCPQCGAPSPVSTRTGSTAGIVTTQQTSKGFKAAQVAAMVMMVGGLVSCSQNTTVSASLWMGGFVLWFVARFGAWWRNG